MGSCQDSKRKTTGSSRHTYRKGKESSPKKANLYCCIDVDLRIVRDDFMHGYCIASNGSDPELSFTRLI
jgi:hypothetical protein